MPKLIKVKHKWFSPKGGGLSGAEYRTHHVYDDDNWRELITPMSKGGAVPDSHMPKVKRQGFGLDPSKRPEHHNFGEWDLLTPDIPQGYRGYVPDFPNIPKSEWDARIDEMDAKQMWPEDQIRWPNGPLDQNGLGYCWVYAVTGAVMATRTRQMGRKNHVRLSATSVGGPIRGWRNEGGWPSEAIEYAFKSGFVPMSAWPEAKLDRNLMGPTEKYREHYKILEAYRAVDSQPQAFTGAFRGLFGAVCFMWQMHALFGCMRVVKIGSNSYGCMILNSWGNWGERNRHGVSGFSVYAGSKGVPDEVDYIGSVTTSKVYE